MEAIALAPLVGGAVILLIALIKVFWNAAAWYGAVNSDRDAFKSFMVEIRDKLDQIFERLPPRAVVSTNSPLQLTGFGEQISTEIDAKEIAKSLVGDVLPSVKGKQAYDIQEICFAHLNECELPEEQLNEIKQCAFDNGIEQENVRRVMAVE